MKRLLAGQVDRSEQGLPGWVTALLRLAGGSTQKHLTPERLRSASKRWMPVGERVVIVGADLAATELAEFLAERGRRVTLLDERSRIAPEVGLRRRSDHMDRMDRLGVLVNTGVTCKEITRTGVVIADKLGGEHLIPADSVILAGEPVEDTSLFEALKPLVPEAYAIGDCTGLGLIAKATTDAMRVGCAL
jgi:2,4-dienoyl-CoA reductase (NADPH2)